MATLAAGIVVLGGFYTVQLKTGLRLVMLNSNLWYNQDDKMANSSDPAGQFLWLESVLKDAEQQSNMASFSKTLTSLLCSSHFTGIYCRHAAEILCLVFVF